MHVRSKYLVGLVITAAAVLGFATQGVTPKAEALTAPSESIATFPSSPRPRSSSTIQVTLVDKKSGTRIAGKRVVIFNMNTVRCFRAPCPSNSSSWSGVTDVSGMVTAPSQNVRYGSRVLVSGYKTAAIKRNYYGAAHITVKLEKQSAQHRPLSFF